MNPEACGGLDDAGSPVYFKFMRMAIYRCNAEPFPVQSCGVIEIIHERFSFQKGLSNV